MKIAIIGTAHPFRGGLAAYNERLALAFIQKGHDVTIYTYTVQYPGFLFPGKTQYSTEPPPEGLNIIRCIHSMNPLNWIATGNRIKNDRPDLVIAKFWLPFMGACFGAILRRIKRNGHSKVISIIDNIIPHEARIGDKPLTRYFLKPVDALVAMSQNVFDDIDLFDAKKPKILSPHPLYDNFGEPVSKIAALQELGLDPAYRYLLFFGVIRKYKGLDLLIRAFADARFRNQKLKLIIAGEYYADEKSYTDLIGQLGLEDDIIQTGQFIADTAVKYYFNAVDLVVQPYRSATQSGVTQIAYHFNKPMVVTDVGGLAEMCPHGRVGYVVPIDTEKIADAIDQFFNGENEQLFIDNIKEEKKKYSWNVLVDNIIKTCDTLKAPQDEIH